MAPSSSASRIDLEHSRGQDADDLRGTALEVDESRGFMKTIIDASSGRILGCTILGIEGGEIMSMVQIAMMGNLTDIQLRNAIFAHPTLAESLNNLF